MHEENNVIEIDVESSHHETKCLLYLCKKKCKCYPNFFFISIIEDTKVFSFSISLFYTY